MTRQLGNLYANRRARKACLPRRKNIQFSDAFISRPVLCPGVGFLLDRNAAEDRKARPKWTWKGFDSPKSPLRGFSNCSLLKGCRPGQSRWGIYWLTEYARLQLGTIKAERLPVKEEIALRRKEQPRGEWRLRVLWRSAHLRMECLRHDRSASSLWISTCLFYTTGGFR